MPIKIVRNDPNPNKMDIDIIVNVANRRIPPSKKAIEAQKNERKREILNLRKKAGYMKYGQVSITRGGSLPVKYVIHAMSPRYIFGGTYWEKKFRTCYKTILELAWKYRCKTITFPLLLNKNNIKVRKRAMGIVLEEIKSFISNHDMTIYLVSFDLNCVQDEYNLYPELDKYINSNLVRYNKKTIYEDRHWKTIFHEKNESKYDRYAQLIQRESSQIESRIEYQKEKYSAPVYRKKLDTNSDRKPNRSKKTNNKGFDFFEKDYINFWYNNENALKERMAHRSDTFQEYLMYLIKTKKLKNSDVYNRALISKQLFSKIKLNPNYHPDKSTAMCLCVGAKLNLDETKDLLARAGYALSPCDERDIIISFFIEHKIFDMIEIDIVLEEYGLPCFII